MYTDAAPAFHAPLVLHLGARALYDVRKEMYTNRITTTTTTNNNNYHHHHNDNNNNKNNFYHTHTYTQDTHMNYKHRI